MRVPPTARPSPQRSIRGDVSRTGRSLPHRVPAEVASISSPRPVPLFGPLPDGGLPVIETEQSAEPFATNDATGPGLLFTVDQSIPQPLMVPFAMVAASTQWARPSSSSRGAFYTLPSPSQPLALRPTIWICAPFRRSYIGTGRGDKLAKYASRKSNHATR